MDSKDIDQLFEVYITTCPGGDVAATFFNFDSESLDFLEELPAALGELIRQYAHLFCAPQGLPSHRDIDHRIYLHPNTAPVNVRPYRYPQFQKEEMARMVQEMLTQGLIHPSHSPYSSPRSAGP